MPYLRHRTKDAAGLFLRADLRGKLAFAFSSALGAGLFPVAQGTVGTLVGIPLVILLAQLNSYGGAVVIFLFIILAVWSSHVSSSLLANEDPAEVVIDEVAGFLITFFLLPFSWLHLCFGFVLFRLFDILKPFPVRRLEKLKGGLGIVADDLLAGVYANLCLRILMEFVSS
jgi:phosphatidylglycerophosphatase A